MIRRWWFLFVWVAVLLLHNVLHESVHYLAAGVFGEPVAEFRLLTNGWGTSQVVYARPVAERAGAHWLVIAWGPAVVTTLLGYVIYLNRGRLAFEDRPLANITVWYAGIIFLLLDPVYFAVLSLLVGGGGDIQAAAAVGWSVWPAHAVAAFLVVLNLSLVFRWAGEIKRNPERFRSAAGAKGL